jgi:exodeoxyribonuclease-1
MRDKKEVAKLVNSNEPFIYTSGKYNSENEKTTVVQQLFKHPRREAAIVYDLRNDPKVWLNKSTEELVTHWQARYKDEIEQLPVKTIQFNRCPAIAPLGVLDDSSKERINLDTKEIMRNRATLLQNKDFTAELPLDDNVDNQLYDGFWGISDQRELDKVRIAKPEELDEVKNSIKNKRIREMIPLYKARNFPYKMNPEDIEFWEEHKQKVFYGGGEKSKFSKFSKRIQELAKTNLSKNQQYLLTELQLYAESILPVPEQN